MFQNIFYRAIRHIEPIPSIMHIFSDCSSFSQELSYPKQLTSYVDISKCEIAL